MVIYYMAKFATTLPCTQHQRAALAEFSEKIVRQSETEYIFVIDGAELKKAFLTQAYRLNYADIIFRPWHGS